MERRPQAPYRTPFGPSTHYRKNSAEMPKMPESPEIGFLYLIPTRLAAHQAIECIIKASPIPYETQTIYAMTPFIVYMN